MLRISYILPLYNVSPYLDRCLGSIVSQGLAPGTYEIILVDDGSKDDSLKIAQLWGKNRPEIKVISQSNRGQSAARNAGLDVARGTYLWFIDSDDFILAGSAAHLLNQANIADLDLITFGINRVKEGFNPIQIFDDKNKIENVLNGPEYIANYNYNNSPCLYLVKRSFITENRLRFIEGRYCEDGMFTMPLISLARRIAYYPSTAYVYVQHPVSTTQSTDAKHCLRVIDDFIFAIGFIEEFANIMHQKLVNPQQYLKRIKSRQDSYTLFLCIRLLRAPLASREIIAYYDNLRSRQWIPLLNLSLNEYPGFRYKAGKFIISHRILFRCLVYTFKVLELTKRLKNKLKRFA